jgi:hypothetical protein
MLVHALAVACFAFYMIDIVGWQYWIRRGDATLYRFPLNRKPFNCHPCLSAWTGLLAGLGLQYGWLSLELMFLSGVLGLVIDSAIKRFL